eukprot:Seg5636.1 transcript_id=Seg5636.1/GoldUCD/mRNA.D3Y31 product="Protein phosphatase 1B" protein_id=Seg5636.1/GoldUCD/D3Y31
MGLFLDKPKREKATEDGEGNGLQFAVSAMQGWRVDMEDSHSMKTDLAPTLHGCSYFAVFDGHAGDFVSKYAADHLWEEIIGNFENRAKRKADKDGSGEVQEEVTPNKVERANNENVTTPSNKAETEETKETNPVQGNNCKENISTGEIGGTEPMTTECAVQSSELLSMDLKHFEASIRHGFLNIDEKLKELPRFVSGDERSGSTAIAVFVTTTHIVFANCGDSRALLGRNGGKVAFATVDHKPYNEEERMRIEKAGGSVIIQRVNGSLAVSRALGDFDYKRVAGLPCTEQLVSPEPELSCIERSADDEFLVLACDGIWDVMSNQEVADYVRYRLTVHQDLKKLCGELLETCLAKGSKDNMSVVIVLFPGAPKISESAVEMVS